MKMKSLLFAASLAVAILPIDQSAAQISFQITESYSGLQGNDGTEDWIEVTNFGSSVGDTASLFYEDSSADPTLAQQLPSFLLGQGDSAVFLVGVVAADQADAVSTFSSIWDSVSNVGAVDGGGLGGSGDSIVLFDSVDAGANTIDSVSYTEHLVDFLVDTEADGTGIYATVQYTADGTASASTLADGLSNSFENLNLGTSNNAVRLAGSPGFAAIPEPSSALFLSLGIFGLACGRRKRLS